MIVIWRPSALHDLDQAVAYLEVRNPDIAHRFAADIVEAGDSLEFYPYRGRPGRTPGTREITTIRPYVLVYQVEEERDQVTILRLWHAAQDR